MTRILHVVWTAEGGASLEMDYDVEVEKEWNSFRSYVLDMADGESATIRLEVSR